MRVSELLNEELSTPQIVELIHNEYSSGFKLFNKLYPNVLFRGTGGDSRIVNPVTRGVRPNANMSSIVNAFIDTSSTWKNVPRRSRSVIMTSSTEKAHNYGEAFVSIPRNGSKVAHVNVEDFWFASRHNSSEHGIEWINMLDEITYAIVAMVKNFDNEKFQQGVDLKDRTDNNQNILYAHRFNQFLNEITTRKDFKEYAQQWASGKGTKALLFDRQVLDSAVVAASVGWNNFLKSVLSPKSLGVTVQTIDQMTSIRRDAEYWTDGECLLIQWSTFQNL
jgi:hypothetical protein